MFKTDEIKQQLEEETKGTSGHSPLKFLVAPHDKPEQIRRAISESAKEYRDEQRVR